MAKKPGGTSRVIKIIRYSVAAAAVVLLIFLLAEGYSFYRLSPEKLFAERYTPYELTASPDAGEQPGSEIETAYRQKDFREVIRLHAISVLSVKNIFLTGLAYLETGDAAKAISNFQVVLAEMKRDKSSALKDVSEYYLALAYLKNRDYDEAIELMNEIHNNSSHLYRGKFRSNYIKRVKRLKWR